MIYRKSNQYNETLKRYKGDLSTVTSVPETTYLYDTERRFLCGQYKVPFY